MKLGLRFPIEEPNNPDLQGLKSTLPINIDLMRGNANGDAGIVHPNCLSL
jgi:hypothetical protein